MATPSKPLSITPGSRVLKSSLSDDEIWMRLKQAGFDEESIKQKDKAALVAYIAKLEAEVLFFLIIFLFFFWNCLLAEFRCSFFSLSFRGKMERVYRKVY